MKSFGPVLTLDDVLEESLGKRLYYFSILLKNGNNSRSKILEWLKDPNLFKGAVYKSEYVQLIVESFKNTDMYFFDYDIFFRKLCEECDFSSRGSNQNDLTQIYLFIYVSLKHQEDNLSLIVDFVIDYCEKLSNIEIYAFSILNKKEFLYFLILLGKAISTQNRFSFLVTLLSKFKPSNQEIVLKECDNNISQLISYLNNPYKVAIQTVPRKLFELDPTLAKTCINSDTSLANRLYLSENYNLEIDENSINWTYKNVAENIQKLSVMFPNKLLDFFIEYVNSYDFEFVQLLPLAKLAESAGLLKRLVENTKYFTAYLCAFLHANGFDVPLKYLYKTNTKLPDSFILPPSKNSYNLYKANYAVYLETNPTLRFDKLHVFDKKGEDYCEITFKENRNFMFATCKQCNTKVLFCKHLNNMLYSLETLPDFHDSVLLEQIQAQWEARELKIFEHDRVKNLSKLSKLNEILKEDSIVILANKVELIPCIHLGKYNNYQKIAEYDDNHKVLSLQILFNRRYNLKNKFMGFINSVLESEYVSYGTNAFYHTLENFTDKAQVILQYFLSLYPHIEEDNFHNPKISDYFIDLVLQTFKYSEVEFVFETGEKSVYQVKDDLDFIITITMDNEVVHNINLSGKNRVLIFHRNDYFVSEEVDNLYIQKIHYINSAQRKVAHLLFKEEKFSLKYIENEFVERLYPVMNNIIQVDESFKEKHPLKEFAIKSYFDYDVDKKVLTVQTKLFLDEIEVFEAKNSLASSQLNKYNDILNGFHFVDDQIVEVDGIGMFIQADLSALKEVSEVYLSETLQRYKVKKLGSTRLSISVSNGMISAHFSKENELTPEEYALILEAYKTKKNFVLLKDKVIMLDNEKVKELSDFVEDFNLNVKNLGKEAISPMYNMFKIEAYTELNVDIEDKVQDILNEIKNYKTSLYTPLDKFTQIMREYQVEGYKWLKILYNNNLSGILADDMGLGKSLQILSLIEEIKTNQPILIVCPKSLVYNWQNEFKKFHIQTPCLALIGTKKDREKIITMNQGRKIVLITSYDTLVRDIDQYIYVNFEMLLLDEAQNIKNMNSMRAKEVKKVQANHKFVLTGTPIENAISDLWSIFDFLMPKYLYSYERFKGIERRATEFDANELEFIVKKTRPFILRRTKKEVLKDLPDKIEEIVYTEFEDKNRLLYDAVLSQAQELLKITEKGKVFTILPYITKLRELCISPAMLYDGKYDSEKIELAAGLINEAISNKHKVLIFSSFVKSLTLLSDELTKQNIKYLKIIGDTNVKTRQENVDIINDPNREESVLLISLKAGGTGLNITGADIVIHLDPWWNVAAENQATDRAHRIGQKNTVYVYKIVIKDTIEDRVIELQQAKSDLIDKLILADEKGVGTISIDDYSFLLK